MGDSNKNKLFFIKKDHYNIKTKRFRNRKRSGCCLVRMNLEIPVISFVNFNSANELMFYLCKINRKKDEE